MAWPDAAAQVCPDFMTTLERKCTRIAAALAGLVKEEVHAVYSGDFETVTEIQDRAAPLIEFLVRHGDAAAGARELLETCHGQREETSRWLATEMARIDDQRRVWDSHRRRLARVGPAYGRFTPLPPQLSLAG